MRIDEFFLKATRKLYPATYKLDGQLPKEYSDTIQQNASDLIYESIMDDSPLMISRFGSTELNCLVNYMAQDKGFKGYVDYITGKTLYFKWDKYTLKSMCNNAGFFPASKKDLEKFSRLITEDLMQVDILGSWLKGEILFAKKLKNAKKVGLLNLEPYNHKIPWSRALEGKTVLVIHPFEKSIREQYKKRKLLFKDERVLPKFNLKTIKAVQSISNNQTQYRDWFEALESMKEKIDAVDYDIALIGCGAYGMPLAAHVKRTGKKAVHLGGALQLLFGIRGKRWETEYDYEERLMNKYWCRPLAQEIPDNAERVERACYW